jgi:hypothetical protein
MDKRIIDQVLIENLLLNADGLETCAIELGSKPIGHVPNILREAANRLTEITQPTKTMRKVSDWCAEFNDAANPSNTIGYSKYFYNFVDRIQQDALQSRIHWCGIKEPTHWMPLPSLPINLANK